MTTRTYYMPKNRVSLHLINYMVSRVGCSIGELKTTADTIRVPVTCNDNDVIKIEKILKRYDMLEE